MPPDIHPKLYSDEHKVFWMDRRLLDKMAQAEYGGRYRGLATTDPADDETFYDHQSASSAISFLNTYDCAAPFYREIGFFGPHIPNITPSRFKDMYPFDAFQRPKRWNGRYDRNKLTERRMPRNFLSRELDHWQKSVRNYFSALTHVDHHLGRVWDALKSSKHADNTVVILVSDHGYHVGERRRFGKSTLWEQVARVPLIVHQPWDKTPGTIAQSVGLIDVGPTVLDYAGLPPMNDCVGQSLKPIAEGGAAPDRQIPTFYYDNAGIRSDDYRIIRYRDGTVQLFDLSADWWQYKNLGRSHPEFERLYAELVAACGLYGLDIAAEDQRLAKAS